MTWRIEILPRYTILSSYCYDLCSRQQLWPSSITLHISRLQALIVKIFSLMMVALGLSTKAASWSFLRIRSGYGLRPTSYCHGALEPATNRKRTGGDWCRQESRRMDAGFQQPPSDFVVALGNCIC